MNIPHLGLVTKDDRLGWYYSEERPVRALGELICRIVLEGYDEDDSKEDFHNAIRNFLGSDKSLLDAATPYIFQYYRDMDSLLGPGDHERIHINRAEDVWNHVQLGREPNISRRGYGDMAVYVSLECNCDWEEEHGLQLVFREGRALNKVGPFDGHLTNSDAFAKAALEHVIYVPLGRS